MLIKRNTSLNNKLNPFREILAVFLVNCPKMTGRTDFNTGSRTVCFSMNRDTSAQGTKSLFTLNYQVHEAKLYENSYIHTYEFGNCHIGANRNADLPGMYKLKSHTSVILTTYNISDQNCDLQL